VDAVSFFSANNVIALRPITAAEISGFFSPKIDRSIEYYSGMAAITIATDYYFKTN